MEVVTSQQKMYTTMMASVVALAITLCKYAQKDKSDVFCNLLLEKMYPLKDRLIALLNKEQITDEDDEAIININMALLCNDKQESVRQLTCCDCKKFAKKKKHKCDIRSSTSEETSDESDFDTRICNCRYNRKKKRKKKREKQCEDAQQTGDKNELSRKAGGMITPLDNDCYAGEIVKRQPQQQQPQQQQQQQKQPQQQQQCGNLSEEQMYEQYLQKCQSLQREINILSQKQQQQACSNGNNQQKGNINAIAYHQEQLREMLQQQLQQMLQLKRLYEQQLINGEQLENSTTAVKGSAELLCQQSLNNSSQKSVSQLRGANTIRNQSIVNVPEYHTTPNLLDYSEKLTSQPQQSSPQSTSQLMLSRHQSSPLELCSQTLTTINPQYDNSYGLSGSQQQYNKENILKEQQRRQGATPFNRRGRPFNRAITPQNHTPTTPICPPNQQNQQQYVKVLQPKTWQQSNVRQGQDCAPQQQYPLRLQKMVQRERGQPRYQSAPSEVVFPQDTRTPRRVPLKSYQLPAEQANNNKTSSSPCGNSQREARLKRKEQELGDVFAKQFIQQMLNSPKPTPFQQQNQANVCQSPQQNYKQICEPNQGVQETFRGAATGSPYRTREPSSIRHIPRQRTRQNQYGYNLRKEQNFLDSNLQPNTCTVIDDIPVKQSANCYYEGNKALSPRRNIPPQQMCGHSIYSAPLTQSGFNNRSAKISQCAPAPQQVCEHISKQKIEAALQSISRQRQRSPVAQVQLFRQVPQPTRDTCLEKPKTRENRCSSTKPCPYGDISHTKKLPEQPAYCPQSPKCSSVSQSPQRRKRQRVEQNCPMPEAQKTQLCEPATEQIAQCPTTPGSSGNLSRCETPKTQECSSVPTQPSPPVKKVQKYCRRPQSLQNGDPNSDPCTKSQPPPLTIQSGSCVQNPECSPDMSQRAEPTLHLCMESQESNKDGCSNNTFSDNISFPFSPIPGSNNQISTPAFIFSSTPKRKCRGDRPIATSTPKQMCGEQSTKSNRVCGQGQTANCGSNRMCGERQLSPSAPNRSCREKSTPKQQMCPKVLFGQARVEVDPEEQERQLKKTCNEQPILDCRTQSVDPEPCNKMPYTESPRQIQCAPVAQKSKCCQTSRDQQKQICEPKPKDVVQKQKCSCCKTQEEPLCPVEKITPLVLSHKPFIPEQSEDLPTPPEDQEPIKWKPQNEQAPPATGSGQHHISKDNSVHNAPLQPIESTQEVEIIEMETPIVHILEDLDEPNEIVPPIPSTSPQQSVRAKDSLVPQTLDPPVPYSQSQPIQPQPLPQINQTPPQPAPREQSPLQPVPSQQSPPQPTPRQQSSPQPAPRQQSPPQPDPRPRLQLEPEPIQQPSHHEADQLKVASSLLWYDAQSNLQYSTDQIVKLVEEPADQLNEQDPHEFDLLQEKITETQHQEQEDPIENYPVEQDTFRETRMEDETMEVPAIEETKLSPPKPQSQSNKNRQSLGQQQSPKQKSPVPSTPKQQSPPACIPCTPPSPPEPAPVCEPIQPPQCPTTPKRNCKKPKWQAQVFPDDSTRRNEQCREPPSSRFYVKQLQQQNQPDYVNTCYYGPRPGCQIDANQYEARRSPCPIQNNFSYNATQSCASREPQDQNSLLKRLGEQESAIRSRERSFINSKPPKYRELNVEFQANFCKSRRQPSPQKLESEMCKPQSGYMRTTQERPQDDRQCCSQPRRRQPPQTAPLSHRYRSCSPQQQQKQCMQPNCDKPQQNQVQMQPLFQLPLCVQSQHNNVQPLCVQNQQIDQAPCVPSHLEPQRQIAVTVPQEQIAEKDNKVKPDNEQILANELSLKTRRYLFECKRRIFEPNKGLSQQSVMNEKLIKVDNNLTDNCVKLMGRTCEIAKCVKPSPPPPSTVNMCNTLGKKNIGCLNNVITPEMWNSSLLCKISNVNCESSRLRQRVKQEVKRVKENELKKKNEEELRQKQQQEQKQQQQEQKQEEKKQQRQEQQYQEQQQQERHKQQQQQLRQQRPLDSEEEFLINGPPQIMLNDLNYIKMVSAMLNNLNKTFLKVRPHDGGLRKEKYEEKIKNARQALAQSVNDLLMKIDEICEIKTEGGVVVLSSQDQLVEINCELKNRLQRAEDNLAVLQTHVDNLQTAIMDLLKKDTMNISNISEKIKNMCESTIDLDDCTIDCGFGNDVACEVAEAVVTQAETQTTVTAETSEGDADNMDKTLVPSSEVPDATTASADKQPAAETTAESSVSTAAAAAAPSTPDIVVSDSSKKTDSKKSVKSNEKVKK